MEKFHSRKRENTQISKHHTHYLQIGLISGKKRINHADTFSKHTSLNGSFTYKNLHSRYWGRAIETTMFSDICVHFTNVISYFDNAYVGWWRTFASLIVAVPLSLDLVLHTLDLIKTRHFRFVTFIRFVYFLCVVCIRKLFILRKKDMPYHR